jgi:hypothetical protein
VLFLDRKIQRDVVAQLEWEPGLLDNDIVVRVHGGGVTLRGFVDSVADQSRAERLAGRSRGCERSPTNSRYGFRWTSVAPTSTRPSGSALSRCWADSRGVDWGWKIR